MCGKSNSFFGVGRDLSVFDQLFIEMIAQKRIDRTIAVQVIWATNDIFDKIEPSDIDTKSTNQSQWGTTKTVRYCLSVWKLPRMSVLSEEAV